MAQYDAGSQNNITRNVRQYTDLDLFFGKKSSNSDVQEITDVKAVKRSIRNLVLLNTANIVLFNVVSNLSSKVLSVDCLFCFHASVKTNTSSAPIPNAKNIAHPCN